VDTDINHLGGYRRLPRESVPLCFDNFNQECFDRAQFNFQEIDIEVPPDIVMESI
jgi:hypothetical protein